MKKELDEALCKEYPKIFKDRHEDMKKTLMCWGFACDDGWYPLIDTLCALLMWDGSGKPVENPPVAIQVKEKFGGLRFYVGGATDQQHNFIMFAEVLSFKICETCGTMADVFQTKGWIRTTCQKCEDIRTSKDKEK